MALNCNLLSWTEPFKYTALIGYTLEGKKNCTICNWCSRHSGLYIIFQFNELTKSPDSENIAWGRGKKEAEIIKLLKKTSDLKRKSVDDLLSRWDRAAYWAWDVANGLYLNFSWYGERVDSVQRDSVLIFQDMSAVYCHLQEKNSNQTESPNTDTTLRLKEYSTTQIIHVLKCTLVI